MSLEDDLMRIFGGDRMKLLMQRLGMKEGEVIEHPWVNRSIENAQKRVEGHNFDSRKHLLEYDDVMNEQRKAIYALRRKVIGADEATTKSMLFERLEEAVVLLVDRTCPAKTSMESWRLDELETLIRDIFGLEIAVSEIAHGSRDEFEMTLLKRLEDGLEDKEKAFTAEAIYHVSRIIYLQTIDSMWKEHLRDIDYLRQAIGLRGYAQQDPKHEYKKEGFNLFRSMMGAIQNNVLQKVYRVMITQETEEAYQARLEARRALEERTMRLNAAPASEPAKPVQMRKERSQGNGRFEPPQAVPMQRTQPKVGRNDPCPCGSGMKYKKCHMLTDVIQA